MEYKELLISLLIIIGMMGFLLSYGKLIDFVGSFTSWLEIRKNQRVAKDLRDTEKLSRMKKSNND